ncbi:MAG: LacI family DNA-binding transcriptional regulator [Bacteroidales bacterium]|nr:LacI family DNA-binding transcriptional regulator [Bacteroidales bacterium]
MENKQKITIKDIARMTGLSKGTVDRVLHNREGVSRKSYSKVMKVIEELGYEPNIYASLLAQKKERIVLVLLPKYEPGEFWELTEEGITESSESAGNLGVKVEKVDYDQYDIESFRNACKKALSLKPSGVVLAPMFRNETLVFVDKLNTLGIPFVYIDTKLESNSYLAYFGMPTYQSGYLCAHILTDEQDPKEVAIVRIQRDKFGKSDPTINRREGFMDYIAEHFPACTPYNIFINPNKPEEIDSTLEQFFSEHPDVRHIAMFNSRIYLITSFLGKHPEKKYRVVGFDNLAANIKALKDGLVTCLIAQRPGDQAHRAISALTDLLVFGREPSGRDNFMPMDVLTRYNAEYY